MIVIGNGLAVAIIERIRSSENRLFEIN